MQSLATGQSVEAYSGYCEPEVSDEPRIARGDLDPESPEFADALVSLLEEHLSLFTRARARVLARLEDRYSQHGHDLWEWRKVLETYPLPRLLHFLQSESPRAVRLRQCSPFPEVLSEGEVQRLNELVEQPPSEVTQRPH